jgi:RNA polymerase sigma factor (sigma-70 family)
MQEAFARAANQPASAIVDLDAWLFRLVHNLVVDHARASSRRATPAELPSPRDALGSDDRVTLWAAVDRLPPRQRAAVYLRFRSDLDFRTIASVLGITEGGARANCARALETLRTLVDER